MKRVAIGIGCLLLAGLIAGLTAFHNNPKRQQPLVFSSNTMLAAIWGNYKTNYLDPSNGRTLDKQRANITTSEGQSYTMLRAVFQDDQATFDRSWDFTKSALKRPNDALFAYLYGQRPDGSYGILADRGGANSASDADSDIALALILAYQRWQQSAYLEQAKPIIGDIWQKEVIIVAGQPILAANNLEKTSAGPIVFNPSYLAPYAYRIFAKIDHDHPWSSLTDSSYSWLEACIAQPLDARASAGLPPDWAHIDRETGALSAPAPTNGTTTSYSYDALRIPWRIALDYQWNDEPRAKALLQKMSLLSRQWREQGKLAAAYAHNGSVTADYESPAMYGGSIGYFLVADIPNSQAVYQKKLEILYDVNRQSWKNQLGYYEDNWAWFGMAMYLHQLPNLAQDLGGKP
jgi:endoglucanase